MPLEILTDAERRTLDAYLVLLRQRLGENLVSVRVFGSVARGERWWTGMPIRSDLDLLVLVHEPLDPVLQQELLDATYPLFLESGRQLGPQFRTPAQHAASTAGESIDRDAVEIARSEGRTTLNGWPGIEAASRSRQWPRIVDLAERVAAAPELAGLLLLGSFARGEPDSLSDVDFIVVVEPGQFGQAWEKRHELHPDGAACWDYPRAEDREVAAHRWLTPELVLFDGLISTQSGARVADPLVVFVGDTGLAESMTRFDPAADPGVEIELNDLERLYGQLKLAVRAARET